MLVPAAHGETRTLLFEGVVLCASNNVDPRSFYANFGEGLGVVDDSITGFVTPPPASTFTAQPTLPKEFGGDGVPFFGGKLYAVPRNEGEFDVSIEIQPGTGPSHSFTLGDAPTVNVLIQNNAAAIGGGDGWVVGFPGSSSAINEFNFCSLTFGGEASVLENDNYFVPSSSPSEPFAPWDSAVFSVQ